MSHIVTAEQVPVPSLPVECRRPGDLRKDLLQLRPQDGLWSPSPPAGLGRRSFSSAASVDRVVQPATSRFFMRRSL